MSQTNASCTQGAYEVAPRHWQRPARSFRLIHFYEWRSDRQKSKTASPFFECWIFSWRILARVAFEPLFTQGLQKHLSCFQYPSLTWYLIGNCICSWCPDGLLSIASQELSLSRATLGGQVGNANLFLDAALAHSFCSPYLRVSLCNDSVHQQTFEHEHWPSPSDSTRTLYHLPDKVLESIVLRVSSDFPLTNSLLLWLESASTLTIGLSKRILASDERYAPNLMLTLK